MSTGARPEPSQPPVPTNAEIDILAVLWRLGPATVRDVHDALGKDNTYTTTLKQMQLMTERGLLTRKELYRSHVYEPATPQQETQTRIAGDLLRRVFGGSARSLLLGALSAQSASQEELEEIRDMVKTFAKKKKSRS